MAGKAERNWEIWRRYKGGGITQKQLGAEFGISAGRVRHIIVTLDRKVRGALNLRRKMSDEIRDGTLGVEFVFRNELTFSDKEIQKVEVISYAPPIIGAFYDEEINRWDRVEPEEYGSMYSPPFPEWRRGWGEQDTSPAKPRKVCTYYRTITPRTGASYGG